MPNPPHRPEQESPAPPQIFLNAATGDRQAIGEAVSQVYDELRRLAGAEARRSGGRCSNQQPWSTRPIFAFGSSGRVAGPTGDRSWRSPRG